MERWNFQVASCRYLAQFTVFSVLNDIHTSLFFLFLSHLHSVTLSERNAEGFKTAYFHAMASTSEFEVSTRILKNQTASTRSNHGIDFRVSVV